MQNGTHDSSCGLLCSPAEEHLRLRRERPHGARGASELPGPRPRFTAVEDHKNYLVFDLLAAVADHKDIQSLTHFEDSVEDSRTADLAWLTQQDQD